MPPPSKRFHPLPGLRWRGLNLQLFLLIFLPVTVILLVITFGSLALHQTAMRTLVGERDERAARTAAAALTEQLNHRGTAIRGLALRATDQNSPQDILITSAFLDPDFDYGMAFFTPDGEMLASSTDPALWTSLSGELAEIQAAARVNAGSEAVYSAVLTHPVNGDALVLAAAAVNQNAPIAVGAFSPVTLARRTLAGAFAPGEQSTAFIVAPDHQLVYQLGELPPSESPADHPGVRNLLGRSPQEVRSAHLGWLSDTERKRCREVWQQLTPRQQDALRALTDSATREQAAAQIGIAVTTLDSHKTAILRACHLAWDTEVRLDIHFLRQKFTPFWALSWRGWMKCSMGETGKHPKRC